MKKSLCLLLALVILICAVPAAHAQTASGGVNSPLTANSAAYSDDVISFIFDSAEDASVLTAAAGGEEILLGDLNRSGAVNMLDSLIMRRHLAGYIAEAFVSALDTNGDGTVDLLDRHMLMRHLNGHITLGTKMIGGGAGGLSVGYNETENAAELTVTSASASLNTFVDLAQNSISAPDYKYLAVSYKSSNNASDGAVYPCAGDITEPSDDCSLGFSLKTDGQYNLKLADLSDCEAWNGSVSGIALDLFGQCDTGDTVYVDSLALCRTLDDVQGFATERDAARSSLGLEASVKAGETGGDTREIMFNTEDNISLLGATNNASYAYNAYVNCVEMTVAAGKNDPWANLSLSSLGLSADTYKYAVYTYKLPKSNKKESAKAQLFFCSTGLPDFAETCSKIFNLTDDGAFHSEIVDLSANTLWSGTASKMRLDFFCDAYAGDVSFVKSVVFCKTLAAAQGAAAMMEGSVSSTPANAASIWDYLIKTGSKDTGATMFISKTNGESIFNLSGGTDDRFTKAHLENRVEKAILSSLGMTVDVDVLDGFDELKAEYSATDSSNADVTYRIKTATDMYIAHQQTDYTMKKIIFDQDLGGDCDDAAAAAILIKAHIAGECNLLAITNSTADKYGSWGMAGICDYFGADDIAVGENRETTYTKGNRCSRTPVTNYWGGAMPGLESNNTVLRTILAANSGKGDITVITTGPLCTLYALFNSPADAISSKTGRELFDENVRHYVCGGGNFENTNESEYNFYADITATLATVNTMTVPTTFVGSNVAGHIYTGGVLSSAPSNYIPKGCYYYQNYETGNYARNSWDLATVYFGLYGGAGLWQVKSGYNISSYTGGQTIISAGGIHSYLEQIGSDGACAGAFSRGMAP